MIMKMIAYGIKGYMSKLFSHFFKLVKKNKLKNGTHNSIKLDTILTHPPKRRVFLYHFKIR